MGVNRSGCLPMEEQLLQMLNAYPESILLVDGLRELPRVLERSPSCQLVVLIGTLPKNGRERVLHVDHAEVWAEDSADRVSLDPFLGTRVLHRRFPRTVGWQSIGLEMPEESNTQNVQLFSVNPWGIA